MILVHPPRSGDAGAATVCRKPAAVPAQVETALDAEVGDRELWADFTGELWRGRSTLHLQEFLQKPVEPPGQDFVISRHVLRGVGDDDSVNSGSACQNLIDDEFKAITSCSDPRVSRRIKFGRRDTSSSAALDRSSLSNGLGPRINSDPIPGSGRAYKQNDLRGPR